MSHRRAKRIRKELRADGIAIDAEPYQRDGGTLYASNRRQMYQQRKKARQ